MKAGRNASLNHPPNNNARIQERARYWFTVMRSDTRSERDEAEHKIWLNANLAHRRAYREVEELWGLLGGFGEGPEVREARRLAKQYTTPAVYHLEPAVTAEAVQQGQAVEAVPGNPRPFTRRWMPMAMAASIMFVLLGSGALFNQPLDWLQQSPVYQTALGENKTYVLEDGSTIVLDTQTRLSIDFSAATRRIVLESGQARFDVAHDKSRPFVVEAGSGRITALGTAFIVKKADKNTSGSEILVTLLEGKVAVAQEKAPDPATALLQESTASHPAEDKFAPAPTVTLEAGQQVAYSPSGISAKAEVDLEQATAWQEGRLVFEDHSLAEVLADLNRYSSTKILLGNSKLDDIRITGVFKTGDNKKVVQTLTTYFNIRATNDNYGNLILTPAG